MLTTIRNTSNRITGVCEWWLVNPLGQQDWQTGTTVWVEQLELSERVHSMNIIHDLIGKIAALVPQATHAYWVRRDKPTGKIYTFGRATLVRGGMQDATV